MAKFAANAAKRIWRRQCGLMTFRSNDRRSACSGGRPSLKKIISSSKTRYTIHREGQEAVRAVDKRAGELNAEYLAKAKHTDQTY